MNDQQPLGRWMMGVALCLSLTQSPGAISDAYAEEATAERGTFTQVLAQRLTRREAQTLPVNEFYRLNENKPLWQDQRRVDELVSALNSLEDDGLLPSDYQADTLGAAFVASRQRGIVAQADFDLQATRALLLALEHLSRGKVDPEALEPEWDIPKPSRDYSMVDVVHAVADDDVPKALSQARPATPEYAQLRRALRHYRQLAEQGSAPYLAGRDEALRLGDEHSDVLVLRQRLAHWGAVGLLGADGSAYPQVNARSSVASPERFDADVEQAVRRFQRRHTLNADGVVGERTRLALNTSAETRVDQLRVNLERARWMRDESDTAHVWVDIAGYQLHYTRPNGQQWSTRVVVGSPRRQTPVIHSAISHLTVNPTWTVPPTIMREDVLPRLRQDSGSYLTQHHMQVVSFSGEVLDPEEIDWQSPGGVMIRQVAGAANPLGRVVVRFPNNHMIYLHDTPAKGLFGRGQRALSSGCVRVEGVREFAQLLLRDSGSQYRLNSLLSSGGSDRNINLPQRIPVALQYLTAWPNAQGEVEFREDIYRRDQALLTALSQAA